MKRVWLLSVVINEVVSLTCCVHICIVDGSSCATVNEVESNDELHDHDTENTGELKS